MNMTIEKRLQTIADLSARNSHLIKEIQKSMDQDAQRMADVRDSANDLSQTIDDIILKLKS